MANRYDPQTGHLLEDHPLPLVSQFRDQERALLHQPLNWERECRIQDLLAQYMPEATDLHLSGSGDANAMAPPILAGPYLVHRALRGDSWLGWSLTGKNLVFRVDGGENLGLAASPFWDGMAINILTNEFNLRRWQTHPDLVADQEAVIDLPGAACRHAAPLILAESRQQRELRHVFIATRHGLVSLALHEEADIVHAKPSIIPWHEETDADWFWSPVALTLPGNGPDRVVVTFHGSGGVWLTWLDNHLHPAGEPENFQMSGMPSGSRLLPPVVSKDGLWCFCRTNDSAWISLVDNLDQLRNGPKWHQVPALSGMVDFKDSLVDPARLSWPPLTVRGHEPGQGRVVYIGQQALVKIGAEDLKHDLEDLHPTPYPQGLTTRPAFVHVNGNDLLIVDPDSGKQIIMNLFTGQAIELTAVPQGVAVGGPFWLGHQILWPTQGGLVSFTIPFKP